MTGFAPHDIKILRALHTPKKIQDFLETIKTPSSRTKDTCKSPAQVLRSGSANCMEGAMLAATALRMHKKKPLVLDLETTDDDDAHVIALFRVWGYWGAISKANHAVLRYRDPIYRSIRELVLSYFHEYFLENGKKTLRSYSSPVDLSRFDHLNWMSSEDDIWYIPDYLARRRHIPIVTKKHIASLRKADPIERKILKIVQWK